jgi:hypothetical protein
MNINTKLFFTVFFLCFLTASSAQVTIGSLLNAVDGALLEIKDRDANAPQSATDVNNVTSTTGGLELPRVQLANATTLEPFIPPNAAWTANIDKVKEKHAGLMVYNIKVSDATQINPDLIFHEGIYTWNGKRWVDAEPAQSAPRSFYLPAFKLPMTSIGQTLSFNLYDEYRRQFSLAQPNSIFISSNPAVTQVLNGEKRRLYEARELDFAITYYNSDYVEVIDVDTDGNLTYKALSTMIPEPIVLINVIFIIK